MRFTIRVISMFTRFKLETDTIDRIVARIMRIVVGIKRTILGHIYREPRPVCIVAHAIIYIYICVFIHIYAYEFLYMYDGVNAHECS